MYDCIFFSQNNILEKIHIMPIHVVNIFIDIEYSVWIFHSDVYRLKLLITIGNGQTKRLKKVMVYFPKSIHEHFAK